MQISQLFKLGLLCASFCAASSHAAIASFDDLALPPALNAGSGLQYTNPSNSLLYQGVLWDERFSVFGDQYRVNSAGGPVFGVPHSGHYFVTNQGGASGLTIQTNKILTSAWFGRNQYYGFGEGGADQITIIALQGSNALASVVFDLPDSHPGQAEPLSLVDTSSFSSLSGITGYRIERRELGSQSGHWVADDFQFSEVSSIPEPTTLPLLAFGLSALFLQRRWQAKKK